jgi:hypothetical protein
MTSVLEWMASEGEDLVDVWDFWVSMGRAWGLPYGTPAERTVQDWILRQCQVEEADADGSIYADVWDFVKNNLELMSGYARIWTGLAVDDSEEGIANGVALVMYLMSGEADLDSYPWLAERVEGRV